MCSRLISATALLIAGWVRGPPSIVTGTLGEAALFLLRAAGGCGGGGSSITGGGAASQAAASDSAASNNAALFIESILEPTPTGRL